MKTDTYIKEMERLRAEGYADAANGRPDRSGSLSGPKERLEYYKGWEDWHVQNQPEYKRWTPSEGANNPLGRRSGKD